jgi:hypothetical protein
MSEVACRNSNDRIYLETEIIAQIMTSLDNGDYDPTKSHLLGWCLLKISSIIRDVLAHLYVTQVTTLPLLEHMDKAKAMTDPSLDAGELLDIAKARQLIYYLPEDDMVRVMSMTIGDGMTRDEVALKMGISSSSVSRIYGLAMAELNAMYLQEAHGGDDNPE